MPGFVREHLRPLAGAVSLHVLLFALFAATAWRWTSSRPAAPLAIEGVVVDERSLPREATAPRSEPAAPPAPAPEPVQSQQLAPEPAPAVDAAEQAREQEVAAQAERERTQREAERAALEARRAEETERARLEKVAAEEAARKAAQAEAERRKAAEAAAHRKEAEAQRDREAELKSRLAAEEEAAAAMAASGVVDQYRAELEQAIERSWIRPPSAQAGLACTLYVTQAPGGTVLNVKLGSCNGDAAVRESITTAVFRAEPLPAPADPRAFQRQLEIVFRPTE